MAKLKLDLHDIYNRGQQIDQALEDIIEEALRKKIKQVEIIPGKGSGLPDDDGGIVIQCAHQVAEVSGLPFVVGLSVAMLGSATNFAAEFSVFLNRHRGQFFTNFIARRFECAVCVVHGLHCTASAVSAQKRPRPVLDRGHASVSMWRLTFRQLPWPYR